MPDGSEGHRERPLQDLVEQRLALVHREPLGIVEASLDALRVEDAELDARLDELAGEDDVREAVADFNRRVKLARMQLLGGPPVVTPLRDVEAEVQGWAERRAERARAASAAAPAEPRRRWWRRR